jgi:hypothetical protein
LYVTIGFTHGRVTDDKHIHVMSYRRASWQVQQPWLAGHEATETLNASNDGQQVLWLEAPTTVHESQALLPFNLLLQKVSVRRL